MMSEASTKQAPSATAKPYPRPCGECGAVAVQAAVISYPAEMRHDGRVHQFQIPALNVDRCPVCGEIFFTSISDEQLMASLRTHLGLLQPAEIVAGLDSFGLTREAFADQLGIAPDVVSGWIDGETVQPKPLDKLMRLFFSFQDVRDALATP